MEHAGAQYFLGMATAATPTPRGTNQSRVLDGACLVASGNNLANNPAGSNGKKLKVKSSIVKL